MGSCIGSNRGSGGGTAKADDVFRLILHSPVRKHEYSFRLAIEKRELEKKDDSPAESEETGVSQ